jgi:hypothetical protein
VIAGSNRLLVFLNRVCASASTLYSFVEYIYPIPSFNPLSHLYIILSPILRSKMSSTIANITSAIPSLGRARLLVNSADDVVIVSAVRTPITRVSQLALCTTHPISLLSTTSLYIVLVPRQRISNLFSRVTKTALIYRPRKVDSKIAYPKIYSPLSSKRPLLGRRLILQRLGKSYLSMSSTFSPS